MRYLKLFEGFVDDFKTNINSLTTKYNSDKKDLFKNFKEEVDQFMFDLTDEYSDIKDGKTSYIHEFLDINIYYYLKCKWVDFEKLIGILQEVSERLKSALGLELLVLTRTVSTSGGKQWFNNGEWSTAKDLLEFYPVRNTKYENGLSDIEIKELEDSYQYVKFEVNIYYDQYKIPS